MTVLKRAGERVIYVLLHKYTQDIENGVQTRHIQLLLYLVILLLGLFFSWFSVYVVAGE